MKPNKEAIQKWVDALRSGKYTQALGYLERDDKYCCLGVAEHINGGVHNTFASGLNKENLKYYFNDEFFKSEIPVKYNGKKVLLSSLNDGLDGYESHTFEEIADIIEDNFL